MALTQQQGVNPASVIAKKKPSVLGTAPVATETPLQAPKPPLTSTAPTPLSGYQSPVVRPPAPGSPVAGAPAGFAPINTTMPVLKPGVLGTAQPVSGGPVASAPFDPTTGKTGAPAAPVNLEQTLTGQYTGSLPVTKAAQTNTDAAVAGLTGGPDRTALAKQAFTDYLSQSGDQFNKDIRAITQRNAATGRLGSGMYGSDLVDAATAADKNRAYAGNQLAQDLANGTISDQFNRVGVLGNLEQQRFGQGQTGLQNLLGYGQQGFQNQLATQQQQQSLDDQQFRQLLATLQLQG